MTQQTSQSVKQKLSQTQTLYKTIETQITQNLKFFNVPIQSIKQQDIVLDNKQTFQTIERNLQDIRAIYQKDIDKFAENVDKGIAYNESLYDRVEKDVNYLHNDLQLLKKKIINLQKRTEDMENQIGNMNFQSLSL